MAWAEPAYEKEHVNRAGRMLVRSMHDDIVRWDGATWGEYWRAIEIINNWRGSHGYPLNTFQMNLRGVVRRFETEPLIAERIKRLYSIGHKLERFPSMKLTQVQDLGGCRAILSNVAHVRGVQRYYLKKSSIKHPLSTVDDYIATPKNSGYRGVHLVYRYFSDKNRKMYNGMKIEMQIRSKYQHAWATAVETVGMFSGQALKSSLGSEDWQRFFALMGSAIAMRESAPAVPGVPTRRKELIDELRQYAVALNVDARLREYGNALQSLATNSQDAHYFLLELDPGSGHLKITGFVASQAAEANEQYAEAEKLVKENPSRDAVLVSVDSINALSRAYPNYFADTRLFAELMSQALSGRSRGIRVSAPAITAA